MIEADARIAGLHTQILEKTRSAEIFEGDLNLLRERIASAGKDIERLTQEDAQAVEQRERLSRQQADLNENRGRYEREVEQLRKDCEQLESEAAAAAQDVSDRETMLEQNKESMIRSFNALSDVRSAQARLSATREALVSRLDALSGGDEERGHAVGRAQQAVDAAQQALDDAKQELKTRAAQRAQAMDRQAALQVENQQLGANIQRAMGAQREAQSRLKMLEQMRRDYEGYQNSVR